jgi:Tetratricopeptide repeat
VADLCRFAEPPPSYECWECNQISIAYATLLLQQGLAADAETQARAALEIAPESAPLRMRAGRIALHQGRLPEAIASLSKLPGDSPIYWRSCSARPGILEAVRRIGRGQRTG